MPRITPNLWFDTQGKEAAEFYCSVFPNSKVTEVTYYSEAGPGPAGSVLTVSFELDGQEYTAINGGPDFIFTEAICSSTARTRRRSTTTGAKLTDRGEEVQCGWLKDRYGLSWQVCPPGMGELLGGSDPDRAARAMKAMFGMKRLDLAALQAAADAAWPTRREAGS